MNQEILLEDKEELVEESSAENCREMQNTTEEANIVEEQAIVKPEFDGEPDAKVISTGEIEENIAKVKDFAIKLGDYYETVTFDDANVKTAREEAGKISNFKDKVATLRKNTVEEFKKPLEKFENTAKEAEQILDEIHESIYSHVRKYDADKLKKIENKCSEYFNEYAKSKNIDFVTFEKMELKITKQLVTKTEENLKQSTIDSINKFIDDIETDLNTIKVCPNYVEEILVEYKKTLKCGESIVNVQDRHKKIEEETKKKEEQEEKKLTDETMLNRIDEVLTAPSVAKINSYVKTKTTFEAAFIVRAEDTDCLKEIKKICENYNAQLISLNKEGDVYHE